MNGCHTGQPELKDMNNTPIVGFDTRHARGVRVQPEDPFDISKFFWRAPETTGTYLVQGPKIATDRSALVQNGVSHDKAPAEDGPRRRH